MHLKCRNCPYGREPDVVRAAVPDDKVAWNVAFPEYSPVTFTTKKILEGPSYADADILTKKCNLKFNAIDGQHSRKSFMGTYDLDKDGLPKNPMGRTGIRGRGCLGRWGPNHAADPIVTRWRRDDKGAVEKKSGRPVLEFVSILRGDTKEWALPGGMVDANEDVSLTLRREFSEEAMDGLSISAEERAKLDAKVAENFKNGKDVYRGYVDDPRNTDNAWMETVAVNFHDETGEGLGKFALNAGDDAVGVKWTVVDSSLKLYASHRDFVEKAAKLHNAHW